MQMDSLFHSSNLYRCLFVVILIGQAFVQAKKNPTPNNAKGPNHPSASALTAIIEQNPESGGDVLAAIAAQAGGKAAIAEALKELGIKGSVNQIVKSVASGLEKNPKAVALGAAKAIQSEDDQTTKAITQAVSEAVAQNIEKGYVDSGAEALAALADNGAGKAASQAISSAARRGRNKAAATEALAQAFSKKGKAVGKNAGQAIAEETDGSVSEVVVLALAESFGYDSQESGHALGSLCAAGQRQILVSAEALNMAVAYGNRDKTAEAYSMAIGSASLEDHEVQAVAQAGAYALTYDGVMMAEVFAYAVIEAADGGHVEASAVVFAELATSENGVLFVEAVARAVSELPGGCLAISEAVSRARIENAAVIEVESYSGIRIECSSLALVACESKQCVGLAAKCCKDYMVPGDTCDLPGARSFAYVGYCEDSPARVQLESDVGHTCYCLA